MSEIEKMYENAGVDYEERYNNCTLNKESECKLKCSCDICKYSEEKYIYPPFTAEKQLLLIQWLAEKDYGNYKESLLISIRDGYNYLSVGVTTDFDSECFYEDFTFDNKQFDEAIAGLINNLWQDLTEEEKQQVKGILE